MNEKWLSKKLRDGFSLICLRTFESCGLPDVPDLYAIAGRGMEFWVELKCVKSDACLIPFRKGQPAWIDRHCSFGGLVFVLVLDLKSGNLFCLEITRPTNARLVATLKLRDAINSLGVLNWRVSLPGWPESVERGLLERARRAFPPR